MDKQQLLAEAKALAESGQLTQAEILSVFPSAPGIPVPAAQDPGHRNMNLSEIMYYIGGAIVFLGICVMVYQNWDYLGSFLRIFVTLGSAIAAFVMAAVLYRYENLRKIGQAFFLISGMLAPLGMNIAFKESGVDITQDSVQILGYIILTVVFLSAFAFWRQAVLLLFGIIFATALYHYIVNILVGNNFTFDTASKVWYYRLLVIGIVYMCLGYYLSKTSQAGLRGALYGFGSMVFLGAAMALGGWQPNQNIFWELIYPLLVFGVIFLSVVVKSKAFLTFGAIFLIGYVLKLTGEYFTSGLGWPLALIIAGLAIIAIGYYALRFNKQYLSAVS